MDRREALKKLAVGGTIAAGAPLVLSSVAFATNTPTAPTVTATATNSDKDATIQITQNLGTCTNSGTPSIASSYEVATGTKFGLKSGSLAGTLTAGATTTVVLASTNSPNGKMLTGDSFSVTVATAFTCLNSTKNCTYSFPFQFNGSTLVLLSPSSACT